MAYTPPNPNGQAVAASSAPVVIASDQANSAGTDSNQIGLLQAGIRKEASFSSSGTFASTATDASNYQWVSVQITAQGTGGAATFQVSNDNSNWVSIGLESTASTQTVATTSPTTTGMWHGPCPGRYFRMNVTHSSGTTSGVIEFFAFPSALQTIGAQVTAAQNGTWTIQPGNTANTTAWLFTDRGASASLARVATSTTAATLLASNASRKEAVIVNESAAVLYVKFGTAASATDYTYQVAAGLQVIEDKYTGLISGALASGSGTAQVTEVS